METKEVHGERSKLVHICANCVAICVVHLRCCVIIGIPHSVLCYYDIDIQW